MLHGSWNIVSNFWLSMYARAKPADSREKIDITAGGVKDGEMVCKEY